MTVQSYHTDALFSIQSANIKWSKLARYIGQRVFAVLTTGNFNHRLLSEMICHKDFQRMMLDAEIYVDRIADMRITNMNATMETNFISIHLVPA